MVLCEVSVTTMRLEESPKLCLFKIIPSCCFTEKPQLFIYISFFGTDEACKCDPVRELQASLEVECMHEVPVQHFWNAVVLKYSVLYICTISIYIYISIYINDPLLRVC